MRSEFPELIRSLPEFDGPFDAFKLESDNFKVLFASYPAGTEIAAHDHDTENVGVVIRGCLKLTTEGESQQLKPGDWYHLDRHQQHAAAFDQDTHIIEFWFEGAR